MKEKKFLDSDIIMNSTKGFIFQCIPILGVNGDMKNHCNLISKF